MFSPRLRDSQFNVSSVMAELALAERGFLSLWNIKLKLTIMSSNKLKHMVTNLPLLQSTQCRHRDKFNAPNCNPCDLQHIWAPKNNDNEVYVII